MTAVEMITEELTGSVALPRKTKTRLIVVATDGSDNALAAYNAARLIQKRTGAAVHVLSVLETIPIYFPPTAEGMFIAPQREDSGEEAQRMRVGDQLRNYDPEGRWTTDVALGRPAEVIVDCALGKDADLIVVGVNRHSVLGRALGEDTAMEIARLTEIPLLVASPDMYRLPKRVTVAMDLNPGGLEIVSDVLPMIADTPSIVCVHVKPRSEWLGIDWADLDREIEFAMNDRFKLLETSLSAVHLRPDLVVLHGEPVDELIDYAARSKTELIVVGVKRRRGRSKAIGGRIAGRVLRRASSSVLIVPGPRTQQAVLAPAGGTTSVLEDPHLWDAALREFTMRNAGRIADIEVDDPEIGALIEASGYPLVGVDYDHKDGRITIMLGDSHGTDRHFTRSIGRPESLSVLQVEGRDKALSVKHGNGADAVEILNSPGSKREAPPIVGGASLLALVVCYRNRAG